LFKTTLLSLALWVPCQLSAQTNLSDKTNSLLHNNASNPGFIENKGQIVDQDNKPNPGCLYLLNLKDFKVQLRKDGFSYEVKINILLIN